MLGRLHKGEVSVIVFCAENNLDFAVLDDKLARSKASQIGINVIGTFGIILLARQIGLIHNIESEIKKLKTAGLYISDLVIKKALETRD